MIKVASKNKKKRSHSPAESNNSFVKNVTSTVSYLLPSSITKWFSPSSNSKANGSTTKADATDSSSEDEIPETSVVVQPPPKRMRYNSGKLSLLSQSFSEVNYSTGSVDAVESYDVIQSASSNSNHFKREPNYVSTPIHTVINEPSSKKRERETTVIQTPPYSTKGSSVVTKKRKSLYEMLDKPSTKQGNKETMSKNTTSLNDYSQPYFKASLACSPFYRGKLAYGGAASSYMNLPNIKSSKTTRVNETNNRDNTISYSARRVMDLFEHYSSPLSEAKRISPYVTAQNSTVRFNKTMENTSPRRDKTYKTRELHVPSIASILSLKHRSRLMDTTNAARQLIASHSSAINCMPYPKSKLQSELLKRDNREKLTTKVKSRITRTRGNSTELVNDLLSPIKLPTAILEIDQNNLPKFNFGNPAGSTPIREEGGRNVKTIRTVSTTSSETKCAAKPKELSKDVQTSEMISSNNSNSYKFATPVIVSRDLTIPSQVPKFTFEDPMQDPDTIDNNEKKKTRHISTTEDTLNINKEKSKDWKCSECWVNNKADASNCVCGLSKKPGDNNTSKTCSICHSALAEGTDQDKCSKCKESKKSIVNSLTPVISSQNSEIWKCGDCWVDNSETAEKCVCCGFKNPKFSEGNEKQPNAIENDWKCDDCWVKNKHNIEKCIACGGVKPKSASSTPAISLIPTQNLISSSFSTRDKTFNNILKSQTDKWECSNCLVRNDNEKTKCVCCDTEKTGVIKEVKTTNFNFGMNTGVSFKFGINPKAQVDNSNKDMESEESIEQSSTKDKWETNNNILAKTPTFTFGLPVNKLDDTNKSTLLGAVSKADEVPKLNFSFGIPKQTTNQTASNIIQNNTKEKEATPVAEEKFQEVPSINFTPTQNVVCEPKNLFESNKSSQESLSKMPNLTSTSRVVPDAVTQENSIALKPLIVQTTKDTEKSKANTFAFAHTGLKISSNLFSAPTSTTANASSSNNSGILPVPVTNSTPLFKKSDLNMNPAVALFQRVESSSSNTNLFQNPATTRCSEATASTFTTSSKLFSFGSNTQSSLPEPSQPKFNFSFGNTNNTDTTPVFNATFGINKDSNTSPNSNKFTLSTANNGGSNPLLPGSSLVSGNLITTGNNPIMSNTSTGNNGIPTVNTLSVPDLGNNSLNTGNSLKTASNLSTTPSNGIFGGTGQKENMWSNTNNSPGNLFVSNVTTNSLQRPGTFTFGSSTPFNANNNAGTAFGNNTSNVFTMQNPSTNLPTLFSTPPQPQAAPSIFGNQQTTSNPAPTMDVFGNSNPPTNSFNVQSPPIPTFEAQAQNPVPAPSFNFGSPQLGTAGVFGFGQQQPQQQFQSSVYNFGASQGTPQFNMGSAPNTTVRRVRKAVRRTQR